MDGTERPAKQRLLFSLRHPARRDGVVALAFFLLPGLVAFGLFPRDHHLDGGTIAVLVSVSLGLPVLWLTWALYRDSRRAGDRVLAPGEAADRLATAVQQQWQDEAIIRGLNDPFPLPVSWVAADASLTDSWDSLVELASNGAGWSGPQPAGVWARKPDELSGTGNDLAEVLTKVPTGRLVVLGQPGSGKTMLMVRLVLGLLAGRAPGGPVPVLVSASSWNPEQQSLQAWLTSRLILDHPGLGVPSLASVTGTLADSLFEAGLILPVVDGLDEIPLAVRGPAIAKMNDAVRPGTGLVVTCRVKDYRAAARPHVGPEVTMRAAAVVHLVPLDADAVSRYLRAGAPGTAALARWEPVLAELGTQTPLGQTLTTPLMVGLARAIYDPSPGELGTGLASPAELCSPALISRDQVEARLLDGFIPAVYRRPAGRWTASEAEKWHLFLARHLEQDLRSLDLAWWELPRMVPAKVTTKYPGRAVSLAIGALLGVSLGIHAIRNPQSHLLGELVLGCIGLIVGWGIASLSRLGHWSSPPPSNEIRVTAQSGWRGVLSTSLISTFGLLLILVIYSQLKLSDSTLNETILVGGWFGFALLASSALNLGAVPIDAEAAANPPDTLRRDRRAAIRVGLASGGMSALIAGLFAEFPSVSVGYGFSMEAFLVCALAIGLPVALRRSRRQAASPSYGLAVLWLAAHQKLPLSLMEFFEDAHRRGVFRQNGATYQFRHRELQRRLAAREIVPDTSRGPSAKKQQLWHSRR